MFILKLRLKFFHRVQFIEARQMEPIELSLHQLLSLVPPPGLPLIGLHVSCTTLIPPLKPLRWKSSFL